MIQLNEEFLILIMAQRMQIIDRRSVKFLVKENFKGNASKKDLRDVKLDPLLDSLKTQNIGISSSTSLKLKLNVHRSLKVAEIETIFKGSKLGKQVKNQNLCSESQEILIAAPKKKINKGLSQSIEFRKERPLEKKKIIKEIDGLWKLIVANLKKNRKISILDNVHWTLYRVWRVIMRNGLRKIQKSWKKTRTSAIKIQKNFKMHLARKNFGKKLLASKLIQHYWKHTWGARKSYLRTKRLISFVQVYARKRFQFKSKAAILIQKHVKSFFSWKKYRKAILLKLKTKNHREMLMRQSTLVKERNRKRNAVKVIEKKWLEYKEKLNRRAIRKYLFTLPYECRLLYLKFKQVKQDADNLKKDVDEMIANNKQIS